MEGTVKPLRGHALLAIVLPFTACLVWGYWTTLAEIAERWTNDPSYSHGFLVPLFAAYLLYLRRDKINFQTLSPSALGMGLIGLAVAMRLAGAYYHYQWFDHLSLIPCIAGIAWLVGGWKVIQWSWPALAFLVFMIPLPHSASQALSGPMQTLATVSSTFLLQVMGRPALAEGNLILLNEVELGVVEACSGLRMLVVFFALSTGVALLIQKPLWEKLVIAFSAIPIALMTNILRITVTGLLHDTVGSEIADAVFHDLAGWLMMPLGLAFLGLELLLLKHLLIEPSKSAPTLVQVTQQRVAVDPLSLYRQQGGTRRARAADAPAEASAIPSEQGQP